MENSLIGELFEMKLHFQRRRPENRIRKLRRKASPEVIMVGLLPEGGGVELLSWAIHEVARSGDILICLIVSHPFSTFAIVNKTEGGVERKNKQMQLGELREACKQKQVEIDIKFAVGDNSEKVLIEQASSAGATTLIIGTSDRFAHLQRRSRGSYCIRNAPAGCSVITVRNSKILHYRDNPVKVPNKSHTISSAEENFIGKGGYAEVYKGSLADGQLVAVKRLTRGQTEEQRVNDFLTELGIMVHINHPNTTHLIGFGIEGGFHLVFEFSLHGSLASWLHGPKSELLDWDIRYRVALGTARGLLYLHEGCRRRIIHRDIKASNILLTKEFEPQDRTLLCQETWLGMLLCPSTPFLKCSLEYDTWKFIRQVVSVPINSHAFWILHHLRSTLSVLQSPLASAGLLQ